MPTPDFSTSGSNFIFKDYQLLANHKFYRIGVDENSRSPYYFMMEKRDLEKLVKQELKALEDRVNQLIEICENLKKENHLLKSRQNSYMAERANLIGKNEQACKCVEAMITRLKSMEVTV